MKNIGLVLTGGGARGAYQAGVLFEAYNLLVSHKLEHKLNILTGTSTGAINVALIADELAKKNNPANRLKQTWINLENKMIYNTNPIDLSLNGVKWMKSLIFGGMSKENHHILSLLDTAPLANLLEKEIDFEAINELPQKGRIRSIAVGAVNYTNGVSRIYFNGCDDCKEWKKLKREGLRTNLTFKHVLASSAIPLVFPAVQVDDCYYGDGSLRDYTPLSAAIHLGAKKLFVIGVRKVVQEEPEYCAFPTPARIISMILNGILLDAVDLDYERLLSMNSSQKNDFKNIDVFMMMPSRNLGAIAQEEFGALGKTLQLLIKGLGSVNDSADLVSYILFEKKYTSRLFELGREDFLRQKDDFLAFIEK